MDFIQNKDYAADSCAISPTAFLLTTIYVLLNQTAPETDFIRNMILPRNH